MAASADISNSAQSHPPTELRIVLIGGRKSDGSLRGKSSVGNIILGQNIFDTSRRTAQSEARQQDVFDRRVTVVDTPGWWWHYSGKDTPKLDQIEIQNSVHLCLPGPHVFLLVIPGGFHLSQIVKPSLKQHLKLFNADVLSHTIVLFTAVAPYSDEKIESKIKDDPVLQWILQQCGNRKHFLNISDREDRDQVKKLLEKIETLITNNGGRYCSVDRSQGETLRKEMRDLTERASKRFDQVQKQRKKLKLQIEDGKVPPNFLRILMTGQSFAGKSSTGNTILTKGLFDVSQINDRTTTHSEIGHSVVEGRRLTVIDSPGWFSFNTLQETSQMDKLEIENSVNLCPPGPHAVLLVIDLSIHIDESYLRSVQEHMSLFSEQIWKHTLVLFTYGDWLGVKTVEEHIESEEGLQWIVNKCENRYHVLNNKDHSNKTQVKELLEKIEEMSAGNEDPYYEVELDRAAELETKRETGDKMVKRLKKINERKSRVLKELFEEDQHPITDINIVLVGQKCSGKSDVGNMILFNEKFNITFERAWLKKTYQDHRETSTCVKHEGNFDGVKVSVVETPGWFSDPTPPDWIKDEVLHSVSMCSPGPHVFLLVVPICRTFTDKDLKALVEILNPLTERVWRHCMVLFSYGNYINDLPVENYIVREGKELQELLEKCRNRYHVLNPFNHSSVQVKELFQKLINMVKQNNRSFTAEGSCVFFWSPKQQTLTEQEWSRREQELIERVMKALSKEPEEPLNPSTNVARSMDEFFIPRMSGDAEESRHKTPYDLTAKWLDWRTDSDRSSGTSSICSEELSFNLDFDH